MRIFCVNITPHLHISSNDVRYVCLSLREGEEHHHLIYSDRRQRSFFTTLRFLILLLIFLFLLISFNFSHLFILFSLIL